VPCGRFLCLYRLVKSFEDKWERRVEIVKRKEVVFVENNEETAEEIIIQIW